MKKSLTFALIAAAIFAMTSVSYAYTVKKGDTMYKIALAANMSLEQLLSLNGYIKSPWMIYPGQSVNTSSSVTVAAQTTSTAKHTKWQTVKNVNKPVAP